MLLRNAGRVLLLIASPACLTSPPPPPEAVPTGTWELTTEEGADLAQLVLTFDENGGPARVTYKLGNVVPIVSPARSGATSVKVGRLRSCAAASLVVSIDNGEATLTKQ